MVERGEGDIIMAPDLAERAQVLIERSRDLGEVVAQNQESADPEQRELAELQLLAAAALDLHIASDIVRYAEAGVPAEVVERTAALPGAVVELQAILQADPRQGMRSLLDTQTERARRPSQPLEARQALLEAVEGALVDIRDDAAAVGQAVVNNLMQLAAPAIKEAANVVLAEVMAKLSEGVSGLINKAVALIAQAVDKVLKALGREAQDEARQEVAQWLEAWQKDTLFGSLLDRLYESDRVYQEIEQQTGGALATDAGPVDTAGQHAAELAANRFNTASQHVAELAAKFRKQKQVITWLLHGLAWARPWIMALQPWGALGLTATYVATLGYTVYLGGDYVDWYRMEASERLNFVPGLRVVVRQDLSAASPTS